LAINNNTSIHQLELKSCKMAVGRCTIWLTLWTLDMDTLSYTKHVQLSNPPIETPTQPTINSYLTIY